MPAKKGGAVKKEAKKKDTKGRKKGWVHIFNAIYESTKPKPSLHDQILAGFLAQKMDCPCGGSFNPENYRCHLKSLSHARGMKSLEKKEQEVRD